MEIRAAGNALTAVKHSAYVPISHDFLVDFSSHVCDDTCPPLYVPAPVPWRRRLHYTMRSWWWRLRRIPGYRLVHKDDIRRDDD